MLINKNNKVIYSITKNKPINWSLSEANQSFFIVDKDNGRLNKKTQLTIK